MTRKSGKLEEALASIPYAATLGVSAHLDEIRAAVVSIDFRDDLVGNTQMPALHGGLIGAFLEISALVTLKMETGHNAPPKTIGVTVEYLRPGRAKRTFARASIKRLGKRIANVHVEAWQDDPATPVALLQGRFLIGEASQAD